MFFSSLYLIGDRNLLRKACYAGLRLRSSSSRSKRIFRRAVDMWRNWRLLSLRIVWSRGFGVRTHLTIIVVITIIVKRKTPASLYLHLGFPQRPKVNLTQEASRALRNDGFHGVSDVLRRQRLRGVLCAARREFRGDASRANHADANAVLAEIFRHAAGKPDDAPLGRAIDSAAGKGVFSGQRADVDNVPRAAADHGRRHSAGNEKYALKIGGQHAIPIGFGLLVGWAEEANPGVVDENRNGP